MGSAPKRDPSPGYSSSNTSDEELSDHQNGSRKRRRLSRDGDDDDDDVPAPKPSVSTISRVKAKRSSLIPKPSSDTASPVVSGSEQTSFASINVAPWLIASLSSMQIKHPTGIQRESIPEILKGRDCIGGSRTGTGKTVAFAVPILQKWAEDPMGIYAVVLT
jgi:ATP-dependent RNA helicase DDX49/DBP8